MVGNFLSTIDSRGVLVAKQRHSGRRPRIANENMLSVVINILCEAPEIQTFEEYHSFQLHKLHSTLR